MITKKSLIRKTTLILNALGFENAQISILITDDINIKKLNNEYRNKNKATNVLSFPVESGEIYLPGVNILGDIVISEETALREAELADISLDQRISQLLVHGILHLVGYDHEISSEEDKRMTAKSFELISLIEKDKNLSYWL